MIKTSSQAVGFGARPSKGYDKSHQDYWPEGWQPENTADTIPYRFIDVQCLREQLDRSVATGDASSIIALGRKLRTRLDELAKALDDTCLADLVMLADKIDFSEKRFPSLG